MSAPPGKAIKCHDTCLCLVGVEGRHTYKCARIGEKCPDLLIAKRVIKPDPAEVERIVNENFKTWRKKREHELRREQEQKAMAEKYGWNKRGEDEMSDEEVNAFFDQAMQNVFGE